MNYLRTILFLFFTNFVCLGQNNPIHNHTFLCGYNDEVTSEMLCNFMKYNSFSNNAEAELKVAEILKPIGIPPNFILVSCPSIQNAVAITYNGDRFIVYDNKFIENIELKSKNKWVNISILSHEIAHHLMAHTLKDVSLDQKRKYELEADEFSGFILEKLGASLEDAQAAIKTIGYDGDDSNSTHPSKAKRLKAIQIGWEKGRKDSGLSIESQNESFESIYNRAWALFRNNKLEESLTLTNKLLELKKSSMVYFLRGLIFSNMNQHEVAIFEYSNAIKLEPDFVDAYYNRGIEYNHLSKHKEALIDFQIALDIHPDHDIYNNIGYSHNKLGNYNDALKAYNNAIRLKSDYWFSYNQRALIHLKLNEIDLALLDTEKALELHGDSIDIFRVKSTISFFQKEYEKSILYNNIIIELDVFSYEAFLNRGYSKIMLKDISGAINDFTRAIDINPIYFDAYEVRADALYEIKEYDRARLDFLKLLESNNIVMIIFANYRLGNICMTEKNYNEAILYFSRVIDELPKSEYLSNSLTERARAKWLLDNNDVKSIHNDLNKAIEVDPNNSYPYYIKGLSYISFKKSRKLKKEGCKYLKIACELGHEEACKVCKEERCR
jgi:tetratricopeptide (TPR) repeat protein